MRLKDSLLDIRRHVNEIVDLAAHPESGWNAPRRLFVHRLTLGLIQAQDVMLSEIVRQFPNKSVPIKHRYKNADRMLGEIDLVSVASEQLEVLGKKVDDDWVIGVDLSDIRKRYAKAMEAIGVIRDGSTGETGVPGYDLVTAAAVDLSSENKALPVPLMFELFSNRHDDFKSETHVWLEAIDRLCDATAGATFAIDSAADNGRILKRLLLRKRDFVVRLKVGENSRNLVYGDDRKAQVKEVWKQAQMFGEMSIERMSDDGTREPYRCDFGMIPVKLPDHSQQLWLCVYDCAEHLEPMVLLTTHRADTPEAVAKVLAQYLARWCVEELHRFAKVSFKLENIRLLTYQRLRNMVAAVWITMGALARFALSKVGEAALRHFELKGMRLKKPLTNRQFWGYAMVTGLRAWIEESPRLLNLLGWLWPNVDEEDSPQLQLFGGVK